MKETHWLIDTHRDSTETGEVGFSGFLYRKPAVGCPAYIHNEAKLNPEQFHTHLNGGFAAFVRLHDRLIAFNDRYGYGKIYICERPRGIILGTDFNEVIQMLDHRTPNTHGILEFLRFGYPLFDYTFLKEVRVLPPGTRLEIDVNTGKVVKEKRYWHFEFIEDHSKTQDEMRINLWKTLEGAVEDCFSEPSEAYAVGNSGGLDSRSILSIAKSKGYDFITYTIGTPDSETMEVAGRMARALGLRQENIYIQSDFVPKYYEQHLRQRPMITLASSWYFSALERLGGCTRNVIGLYGDNTLGIHLVDKYKKMKSEWDLFTYHSIANDEYLSRVTTLDYGGVRDHYMTVMYACVQPNHIKRFDQWNFENRQFRFIMEEDWNNFLNNMEMRCPFMHNDLVDFAFTLPYKWRCDRVLYQEALTQRFPEVARIRLDRRGYSPSDPRWLRTPKEFARSAAKRLDRTFAKGRSFSGVNKQQRQWLMAEPNCSFIVDNLRRPSKIFSEYFNAQFIASNARQLIETNWSVTSNLLSIKLWLERFLE